MTIDWKAMDRAEQALTKAYQDVEEWRTRAWDLEAARGLDKSRHAAELHEQAERFSEAVTTWIDRSRHTPGATELFKQHFAPFVLAPIDPLVEVVAAYRKTPGSGEWCTPEERASAFRAALDARGLAIVKKEAVNG